MRSTQDTIKKYYDSAENFLNAWSNYMDSAIPNDPGNLIMKSALKDYSRKLGSALEKSEKYAMEQPDPTTIDPEQIRQENLEMLNRFEEMYKKATSSINEEISARREYMQTDAYLEDVQENRQTAASIYNSALSNATNALDTMSKLLTTVAT